MFDRYSKKDATSVWIIVILHRLFSHSSLSVIYPVCRFLLCRRKGQLDDLVSANCSSSETRKDKFGRDVVIEKKVGMIDVKSPPVEEYVMTYLSL